MRRWVREEEEEEGEGEGEDTVATEDYSKLYSTKSHCASLREFLSVTHHLDISVLSSLQVSQSEAIPVMSAAPLGA